jgi:hypothetical protein
MQKLHPVDRLFDKLREISPYPDGVVPVTQRIEGTAFFPGGAGLWGMEPDTPLPPMPIGQVMVLGHDFDTEVGYQQSLAQRGENLKSPTWRNLLWLLNQVQVSPATCFFTNAYMGLRAGNSNVTGRFPGARSPGFVQQCQAFLAYQIAVQRPRLILTLGRYVPAVIASLSADLAGWARCTSFRVLDTQAQSLIPCAEFGRTMPVKAAVIGLTHPSIWHRCVLGRCYGALRGKEAELQMLQDAIEVAGIPRCAT